VGAGFGLPFAVRVPCWTLLYRSFGGRGCGVLAVQHSCQGCLGVRFFGECILLSTIVRGGWAWDLELCTASVPLAVKSRFATSSRGLRTGDPL